MLAFLCLLPSAGGTFAAVGSLDGYIFDAAGAPLAGVEVLLGRTSGRVLATRTDAWGEYRFEDLVAGSYLLLATKVGYRATIVRVNTLAASTLDLTLRLLGDPAGADGPVPPRPADESWALRLPVRDILREIGQESILTLAPRGEVSETVADTDPGANLTRSSRFNAEIQQWFSMALGGAQVADNSDDDGRSTEILLGGDNGRGVSWSVAGGSIRSSASFQDADLARVDDETHEVEVSVNVSADVDNKVDITAWFGQSDHLYDLAGMEEGDGVGRRSRTWGYAAHWNSRFRGTNLDLRVGYGSANLGSLRSAEMGAVQALQDEHWRANGSVSFSPGPGHEMRVGMSASVRDFGSEEIRLTFDPMLAGPGGPVGTGRRGWSVNVFGRETYAITEPLALVVGIDYHHIGFDRPVSYLLPQAGVTYRPADQQTLRAQVMFKLEDRPDALPGEEEIDRAPGVGRRVGYLLAWESALGASMSISLTAAIRPYAQERLVEDEYLAFDLQVHRALFVSDGNASSRELSLRLEKRFSRVHTSVGGRVGQVEGNLISYLPSEIPTQALSEDTVRFVSTSVHTAILPSGTRFSLDYQQIENQGMQLSQGVLGPMTYRALEALVQQALFSHSAGGEWRLLVGYREVVNTSEEVASAEELARLGVPDRIRRVSAGVSIRF